MHPPAHANGALVLGRCGAPESTSIGTDDAAKYYAKAPALAQALALAQVLGNSIGSGAGASPAKS